MLRLNVNQAHVDEDVVDRIVVECAERAGEGGAFRLGIEGDFVERDSSPGSPEVGTRAEGRSDPHGSDFRGKGKRFENVDRAGGGV